MGSSVIELPDSVDGPRSYTERTRRSEFLQNCFNTFKDFLIGSLHRRYNACYYKLGDHANEITYADGNTYEWPTGSYNVSSAEKMIEAIRMLVNGQYVELIKDRFAIDQLLKALLNDTEQHPVRINDFKFSELVSILMECHAAPLDAVPTLPNIATSEEAIKYASAFGLENEVMEAMENGMTPMEAVLEWCK